MIGSSFVATTRELFFMFLPFQFFTFNTQSSFLNPHSSILILNLFTFSPFNLSTSNFSS